MVWHSCLFAFLYPSHSLSLFHRPDMQSGLLLINIHILFHLHSLLACLLTLSSPITTQCLKIPLQIMPVQTSMGLPEPNPTELHQNPLMIKRTREKKAITTLGPNRTKLDRSCHYNLSIVRQQRKERMKERPLICCWLTSGAIGLFFIKLKGNIINK